MGRMLKPLYQGADEGEKVMIDGALKEALGLQAINPDEITTGVQKLMDAADRQRRAEETLQLIETRLAGCREEVRLDTLATMRTLLTFALKANDGTGN